MRPVYGDKCFTTPAIPVFVLVDEQVLLMKKGTGRCVVSTTDPAIAAVASLIRSDQHVSINVQINFDNMLKNKRLRFDI